MSNERQLSLSGAASQIGYNKLRRRMTVWDCAYYYVLFDVDDGERELGKVKDWYICTDPDLAFTIQNGPKNIKIVEDCFEKICWIRGVKDYSPLTYLEIKEGINMKSGGIEKAGIIFCAPFSTYEYNL